jgi:hypothetical protein
MRICAREYWDRDLGKKGEPLASKSGAIFQEWNRRGIKIITVAKI